MQQAETTAEENIRAYEDAEAEAAEVQAKASKPVVDKRFPVMEIFGPTIQGEGRLCGVQTLFIRFGGCDYRCKMCDSMHAVLPSLVQEHSKRMTTDEIIQSVRKLVEKTWVGWITLSGGNPAMHKLEPLVNRLQLELGLAVAVETQGSLYADWLSNCNSLCISPKAPGMGAEFELDKFEDFVPLLAFDHVYVKVVVFNALDVDFCVALTKRFAVLRQPGKFYISLGNPMPPEAKGGPTHQLFDTVDLVSNYEILMEEVLQNNHLRFATILPQVHVVIWGNKQGV